MSRSERRGAQRFWPCAAAVLCLARFVGAPPARAAFVTFETGQVRPLALSPDGARLFAINTPDDELEIFDVGPGGLTHVAAVPVGMEPIAVATRTDSEVWVVNHLSDSVSIVDVGANPPRVVRTLLVGDEPRDIVFAGALAGGGPGRAFITCAHRGQNSGVPLADLITEGIGRADVWIFDATNLGASLGGTPLTRLSLFGDTPRALAVRPDGTTVYAAVFHSGNQTTTLSEGLVCDGGAGAAPCTVGGFTMPGGLPAPNTNAASVTGPETGLIVKFEGGQWNDRLGRNWNNAVRFDLPDLDVFAINATANPPAQTTSFAHVGTVLFDMVVNPVNGKVYVSNTDARNQVRFEGPGVFDHTATGCVGDDCTVRGHLHEARITVLDGANVLPRHLNKHIDYDVVPSPAGTKEKSLAIPVGMAVSSNGQTLYLAAFGSSAVGVLDTAALEADTFVPDAADHIAVTGGGPTGLALDEAHGRLYVLTRFDNAVSVIDTATHLEEAHLPLHNPEPPAVVNGRHVLYDAQLTSSNGETSCASCHIFADFDSLAWDLGNPDDNTLNNPNPFKVVGGPADFHPLKGPMTTQSLRGMANDGPMHWRGDRTGGNDCPGNPTPCALDEDRAFKKFIVAFDGLLGRGSPISDADMQAFTDFILQVTYPPNPIRNLDNTLTASQQAGHDFYFNTTSDLVATCNGCHTLDPATGSFGTDGSSTFENETQNFKIPHLRNAYQKVGMFGMPKVPFFREGDTTSLGPQVRGFGFLHDGSVDTVFRFHGASVFSTNDTDRANLEQFVLAFDTNLAPIVGQQITLTGTNGATVGPRISRFITQATAGECDLIAKGNVGGLQRGVVRLNTGPNAGKFRSDRAADPLLTDAQVRAFASTAGQEVTYTCVPPGSGQRLGIDRDDDGFFDRDELDAGSDPADPLSIPGGGTTTSTTTTSTATSSTTTTTQPSGQNQALLGSLALVRDPMPGVDPTRRTVVLQAKETSSPNTLVGNPIVSGATLTLSALGGTFSSQTFALPAGGQLWRAIGSIGFRYSDRNGLYGPVSSVIIKRTPGGTFWLKVRASGRHGSLAVVPPNPGDFARGQLQIGNGDQYCTVLGQPVGSRIGRNDDRVFRARGATVEFPCP